MSRSSCHKWHGAASQSQVATFSKPKQIPQPAKSMLENMGDNVRKRKIMVKHDHNPILTTSHIHMR
ncbi:hypothetical protein J6590_018153 [Homalodisca vitripennis]|nr:hypothetical protein J6590_018153 [Homalodisca vitripennis]